MCVSKLCHDYSVVQNNRCGTKLRRKRQQMYSAVSEKGILPVSGYQVFSTPVSGHQELMTPVSSCQELMTPALGHQELMTSVSGHQELMTTVSGHQELMTPSWEPCWVCNCFWTTVFGQQGTKESSPTKTKHIASLDPARGTPKPY